MNTSCDFELEVKLLDIADDNSEFDLSIFSNLENFKNQWISGTVQNDENNYFDLDTKIYFEKNSDQGADNSSLKMILVGSYQLNDNKEKLKKGFSREIKFFQNSEK